MDLPYALEGTGRPVFILVVDRILRRCRGSIPEYELVGGQSIWHFRLFCRIDGDGVVAGRAIVGVLVALVEGSMPC